jgi:hypothetical protein
LYSAADIFGYSGRKMLQRVGNTAAAEHQGTRISQEDDLFMLFLELALSPMILLSISEELSFNRQFAISDLKKNLFRRLTS